jgi:hypothetical protein
MSTLVTEAKAACYSQGAQILRAISWLSKSFPLASSGAFDDEFYLFVHRNFTFSLGT